MSDLSGLVQIMNLRSVKPSEPFDFIIDRKSPVGNPSELDRESRRNVVCNEYDTYFNDTIDAGTALPFIDYLDMIFATLIKYGRVRLFCWCFPKRCHGLTIQKYLEERYEQWKETITI